MTHAETVRIKQREILEAYRSKDLNKIESLQIGRIRSLAGRTRAVKRVMSNTGGRTPGIDQVVWEKGQDEREAIQWLGEMVNHPSRYKASGRKAIEIPKPNTTEKRILKIPTRKDRARQILYLLATDPVVEETSDPNSYGFRKNRSTNQAVRRRWNRYSSLYGPKWGFETDIEKCFDRISHEYLMDKTPNRYGKRFLEQWLKVETVFKGKLIGPQEMGTPQGGVVSPILCNVALNGIEEHIGKACGKQRNSVRTVRYADDIVVTMMNPQRETTVRESRAEFLGLRGLKMKEKKTKGFTIEEGFDFLGWNMRKWKRDRKYDKPGNTSMIVKMKPKSEAVNRVCRKIRDTATSDLSLDEVIRKRNPIVRGWTNYYSCSYHSSRAFAKVDSVLWETIWKWQQKTNPDGGKKALFAEKLKSTWEWKTDGGVRRIRPNREILKPPRFSERNQREKVQFKNPYDK